MSGTALYRSPVGDLWLAGDGWGIAALRFVGEGVRDGACGCDGCFEEAVRWLDCYFAGGEPGFVPRLQLRGTEFQRRVWRELLAVPHGHTVTYGELARRVGCGSAQAVGQAVGSNPVAIIVPCHRVVAADGLGGYAYGTALKRRLLDLEHACSLGLGSC